MPYSITAVIVWPVIRQKSIFIMLVWSMNNCIQSSGKEVLLAAMSNALLDSVFQACDVHGISIQALDMDNIYSK